MSSSPSEQPPVPPPCSATSFPSGLKPEEMQIAKIHQGTVVESLENIAQLYVGLTTHLVIIVVNSGMMQGHLMVNFAEILFLQPPSLDCEPTFPVIRLTSFWALCAG
jgi:hypothetical protein